MRYRSYLSRLLGVLAVGLAVTLAVNVAVDPFGDVPYLTGGPPHALHSVADYGQRKLVATHLRRAEEGIAPIDLAIFGNSRATAIDPRTPALARLGRRRLNLSFSAARLAEMVPFIARLKRASPQARVLVATDLEHCLPAGPPDLAYIDPARRWAWVRDSLARLIAPRTLLASVRTLLDPAPALTVRPDGFEFDAYDYADTAETDRRIRAMRTINRPLAGLPFDDGCLSQIAAIREAAPEAILFVNPVSVWHREIEDALGLAPARRRWRRALAAHGPVIDFSCARAITTVETNYRDSHHYRPEVGAMIAADLARFVAGEPLAWGCVLGAAAR